VETETKERNLAIPIPISKLKTGRFEAFIAMDVLKPDVLKPDVLKPDVLWVYQKEASNRPPAGQMILYTVPIIYNIVIMGRRQTTQYS
jgi:hypothetical protein